MALSDAVTAIVQGARATRPSSFLSSWRTVIDAGGMTVQDNGGSFITNPASQIADATRRPLKVNKGVVLRLRLAYDKGDSPDENNPPKVLVFGRTGNNAYQRLENNVNEGKTASVPVPLASATDLVEGSFKYTHPNYVEMTFDIDGCRDILVGLVQPYAVNSGDASKAFLQAKII